MPKLKKKIHVKHHYYRYSLIKIWGVNEDENYFPQLEIKIFHFSLKKLNENEVTTNLNKILNEIKKDYDYKNYFEQEHKFTRRRTAYEFSEISKEEMQKNRSIITIYDDENEIRKGFPKSI